MARETVLVPGARNVEATLDTPETDTEACVVACPPHPQHGGHRGDPRLRAVSDYMIERDIACLRFDYGAWDEGYGEREDARNALRWAAERYPRIGMFGFSFGGAIAALAAGSTDVDLAAVSLLAPVSRLASDLDAAATVEEIDAPLQVIYGERDTTADWEPLVERARGLADEGEHSRDFEVVGIAADHFFIGQFEKIATRAGRFLLANLR